MLRAKRLDIRVININGGKLLHRGSSVINEAKVLRKQESMSKEYGCTEGYRWQMAKTQRADYFTRLRGPFKS